MAGHINDVHYDDPRAVQVAGKYLNKPDDDNPHSVVHGAVSIECNSVEESKAIMAAWPTLMADLEKGLRAFRVANEIIMQEPRIGDT